MTPRSDIAPVRHPIEGPLADMYAQQRNECPVAYTEDKGGVWFLFGYEDVVKAARDTATFGSDVGEGTRILKPPIELDPPDHTWFRRALQPFFSAGNLSRLEGKIYAWASDLVRPIADRGQGEVMGEVAEVLPGLVLCDFLGFPSERWDDLKHWTDESSQGKWHAEGEESAARVRLADERLFELASELVAARLAVPKDASEDVVSGLIEANFQSGNPYSDDLVASTVQLLLTAGHGTTTTAIGNSIYHLAADPALQQRVREDLTKIPAAIEESLRVASPVATPRVALVDIEVGGRTIPRGDRVWLVWGSANLDESEQPDAATYSIDRELRHLAFGYGIHKCIGLNLARMEINAVVSSLFELTESFEISGSPVWESFPRYGLSRLPISTEARR